jgi:Mn2+/Fe2+ NRAMP family transporter
LPRIPLFQRVIRALGPGLTTGAAADDPSGVATCAIIGARFGTSFLWLVWATWPLMACVQMMCARVGMVTGKGLAGAFRLRFPRWLVGLISLALLFANTINIAADLAGMADAAQMLGAGPAPVYVWVFGLGICLLILKLRYAQIATVLKWVAVALFAYVITAFLLKPHWSEVLRAAVIPSLPREAEGWAALVAILGTTMSPYLFFWQAGQEVEEVKAKGRRLTIRRDGGVPKGEISDRRIDVGVGSFFSNLVTFFIMLTAALTLHAQGSTVITSSREAASALRPLGDYAYLLYTVGIIGSGLLAIPTLAGSAAYAFAETFDWEYGLDEKLRNAISFYGVFFFATLAGATLCLLHIDPIKAMFWSAVVNGVLAPFLLVALLLISNDPQIMNGQISSRIARYVVMLTTVLMFAAAGVMFFV